MNVRLAVEAALAFVGECAMGIAVGYGFYRFVLRPLGRYLDRRKPLP